MRTNQRRGFDELLDRNSNSLSTLRIRTRIVRDAPLAPSAVECRELRRADTPIAALLPRHDMEMEVWGFLSAKDTVVLEREYSKRPKGLDERSGGSFGRAQYRAALVVGKIEQCRDMPARDNAALASLKLPWVDDGQRMFAFVDDRPSFFAARHPLAKIAGISYGKFDHLRSRNTLIR